MDCKTKIKELRELTGMNRKEFCEYFQIPYRYSGSVVKTQIQSFYNELIYVVEEGEGCSPYAA